MSALHPRLSRQLKELCREDPGSTLEALIPKVSSTYDEVDQLMHGIAQSLPDLHVGKDLAG